MIGRRFTSNFLLLLSLSQIAVSVYACATMDDEKQSLLSAYIPLFVLMFLCELIICRRWKQTWPKTERSQTIYADSATKTLMLVFMGSYPWLSELIGFMARQKMFLVEEPLTAVLFIQNILVYELSLLMALDIFCGRADFIFSENKYTTDDAKQIEMNWLAGSEIVNFISKGAEVDKES